MKHSIAPAALLALTVLACGRPAPDTAASPAATPTEDTAHAEKVSTVLATVGDIDASLIASGSIVAPRTTLLSAEVSGRIASVAVDEGDVLRLGDVAFVVDPEPYEISLEEARAGLLLAEAEAAQEEQELRRTQSLVAQEIVAQQELDYRETQLAVARARVSQAGARLHRAERDLERTVVRAPYDSTVIERHLHEGANLSGPTSVVLTLQALEGFEAQLAIPEAAPVSARVGDPVLLDIQGHGETVETTVLSVNPSIDPDSRTYSIRARVSAAGIKSGSFVRAQITPRATRTGLVLPRDAVLRRDGRSIVFRYDDGRAAEIEVQLGATGLRLAEITGGIEPGDEIIVGALIDRLAHGTPVSRTGPAQELALTRSGGPKAASPPESTAPRRDAAQAEPRRAAAKASPEKPVASAEAAAAPAGLAIREISSEPAAGGTRVRIVSSRPLRDSQLHAEKILGDDPRFILSIAGVESPYTAGPIDVASAELRSIRTGHHPEEPSLHVVLDLVDDEVFVTRERQGTVLTLTLESATFHATTLETGS